ncbi:MAG: hypothetical protein WD379_06815 [Dehalococcoidia bacterium]
MGAPRPAAAALPPLTLAIALTLAALLAACGGGSSSTQSPTPAGSVTPADSTPGASGVCNVDLAAEAPDATLFGAGAGDFLADRFSLASGDFNDDGIDDILVGAPLADAPDDSRASAGEAYVVPGEEDLAGDLDLAQDAALLTVIGGAGGHNLGFTVAAGDVNGDGIDDAIVGARFAGPSAEAQSGEGEAYVIFGGGDLGGTLDIAAGEPDLTIVGADPGDFLSIALGSGDVNGDGIDDIILGAAGGDGPDNGRQESGEAYVVAGSEDLPARIDLGEEEPYLTLWGAEPDDLIPNYLAAGDLTGDGRDEVLIGAPTAGLVTEGGQPRGEAYIVVAPEDAGEELDLGDSERVTRLRGGTDADGFGFYLTSADINGDGSDDAIIGARDADGEDDSRNNAGEAHVLFGGGDLPASIDLAKERLDVTVVGAGLNDSLGISLAAGDVNGDDIPDLLLGAALGDGCDDLAVDAGEAYVIFGRADWPDLIDLGAGGYDLSVFGAEAEDDLAFSLISADVNGDGKEDVIAGALLADGPDNSREDAGEAYVILSR